MSDAVRRHWVAVLDTGEGAEFIRLGAVDDRVLVADRPARGRFNLAGKYLAGDGTVKFWFDDDGQRITLTASSCLEPGAEGLPGESDGFPFRLWPTVPADPSVYRPHIGDVATIGGRTLSLHLNSDEFFGEPMFMYSEGDRVVRLHPIGPGLYLSEEGELLSLTETPSIATNALRWPAAREELRSTPGWTEESVKYSSTDVELSGSVLKPFGDGPFPALVLVHGSAGGRRDLYRIFGAAFARAGIVALIYDKRGHGASTSGPSSIPARADDAEAGLEFAQSLPYVDPVRVGLWGFSNGGWSVPMVTGRRRDVAFAIVVGAPGVSPMESELFRKRFEMTENGVPASDIELAVRAWRLIYGHAITGELSTQAAAQLDAILHTVANTPALKDMPIQQYAIEAPILSPVPNFASHDDLRPVPEPDRDLGYDPVRDYATTCCAVLVLAGDRDANQPAESSGFRILNALARAGNELSHSRIFSGAGHMINLVNEAEIEGITTEELSYRFERFTFAPGFLRAMTAWASGDTDPGT